MYMPSYLGFASCVHAVEKSGSQEKPVSRGSWTRHATEKHRFVHDMIVHDMCYFLPSRCIVHRAEFHLFSRVSAVGCTPLPPMHTPQKVMADCQTEVEDGEWVNPERLKLWQGSRVPDARSIHPYLLLAPHAIHRDRDG
jgi:hypothetical protein